LCAGRQLGGVRCAMWCVRQLHEPPLWQWSDVSSSGEPWDHWWRTWVQLHLPALAYWAVLPSTYSSADYEPTDRHTVISSDSDPFGCTDSHTICVTNRHSNKLATNQSPIHIRAHGLGDQRRR
jgi:hypothetical protein